MKGKFACEVTVVSTVGYQVRIDKTRFTMSSKTHALAAISTMSIMATSVGSFLSLQR